VTVGLLVSEEEEEEDLEDISLQEHRLTKKQAKREKLSNSNT
jgi:hypothetical protein